jgi:hypothetical protein
MPSQVLANTWYTLWCGTVPCRLRLLQAVLQASFVGRTAGEEGIMAVAKITKAMVERPEVPPEGHLVTWDSSPGMGGFGIRVAASGRVSYLVRYWNGRRERWQTLGAYPRLNLTDARKQAAAILKAAAGGADPVEEKRAAEAGRRAAEAQTVEVLAGEWLAALPHVKWTPNFPPSATLKFPPPG